MKPNPSSFPSTWRSIPQSARGNAVAPPVLWKRRFRLFARGLGVVFLMLLVAGGVLGLRNLIEARKGNLSLAGPAEPIQEIQFFTDGVIDHTWLGSQLRIRQGTLLTDVDIFALRDRLEQHGQIRRAQVKRLLPHTLRIEISEYTPQLRLRAINAGGQPQVLLVDASGQIFEGIGHSPESLARLPFIAGMPLKSGEDGKFQPLLGVPPLLEFLDYSREFFPEIFRSWRYLALEDYDPRPGAPLSLIRVVGRDTPEIVFSLDQYPRQLQRLRFVLETFARQGAPPPRRIDLSIDQFVATMPAPQRSNP